MVGRRVGHATTVVMWALLTGVLILPMVTGCSGQQDPRAYPGTQDRTLDDLLKRFQLELPPCPTDGLRYYSASDLSGDLEIRFGTSEDCLERYLDLLSGGGGETNDASNTRLGDNVGISSVLIKKLNWPIDPHKEYDTYAARPHRELSLNIVVDRNGPQPVVYILAIRA